MIWIDIALIVIGFVMLIYGADVLVGGASSIARSFKIPELAIGLTIVSLGTSAPELMVNILSGTSGQSDMAVGNVIGSNIFNTFVILGVASVIYPISVGNKTVWREIPMSLAVGLLILFFANDEQIFGRIYNRFDGWEALILLVFFLAFMTYVFLSSKSPNQEDVAVDLDVPEKTYTMPLSLVMIGGGMALLLIGGDLVVENAVEVALHFGVGEKLIGLTIVSMGTSLPELAASGMAAYKKRSDIAIGNVVGSNIFNMLLILPSGALFSTLLFNPILNYDLALYLFGNILVFGYMFTSGKNKLDRWEGAILLLVYLLYLAWIIYLG